MSHEAAADVAAVLGAAGATLVLVPRRASLIAAGIAVLTAAEALLAYVLVPGKDLHKLVDSPLRIVALAALASVLVLAGLGLTRYRAAVPVLLLLTAAFRVPLHLGEQRASLLLPLYVVLVASVVALLARLARREQFPSLPRMLSVPASAYIALSSLSLIWSSDLRAGTIELLFFLLPFAALVAVVARTPLASWSPRAFAVTIVAVACGLAAVGLSQLWTGDLYFARDLEVANAYTSYFRTTSLFADSSIYGRELVIAIVVLLAALWLERVRLALALPLLVYLWVALFYTYSQSSMVALVAASLALGLAAAGRGGRRALIACTLALVIAAGLAVGFAARGDSTNRVTSGRWGLVRTSVRVFADHPVVGVGVGAQPKASRAEGGKRTTRKNVSHTTPLTVAAELGVVGIAAYVGLLAAAVILLREALRRNRALGLSLAAAFLALFVHSLVYSGFFETPAVWGVLALAAAAAPSPARLEATRPLGALLSTDGAGTASRTRDRWQT
jgi:O-antigen ligase